MKDNNHGRITLLFGCNKDFPSMITPKSGCLEKVPPFEPSVQGKARNGSFSSLKVAFTKHHTPSVDYELQVFTTDIEH